MKNYAPENAWFLFPFNFDIKKLKEDLAKCLEFDFLENYVPENYQGKDYILPLHSINGSMHFGVAVSNTFGTYQNTMALEQCSYFKEVINTFLCEKEAVRLMSLPAGKIINTHTDHNCGYEDDVFRIHIPIQTNDAVSFILNNELLKMKEGEVWYTNVNLPHGVENNGKTNRVHLVVDCIRNEWSDNLFESLGYNFEKEKEEVVEELSKETMSLMIEELQKQDTPAAKELINTLRLKIDSN